MASLVPVLEMTAGTYATTDHPRPQGSGSASRDEWLKYWRDSLADSGITGLEQAPAGDSLVSLSQLRAEVLRVVLRKEFAETKWTPEELGPLSGGYVLQVGTTLIPPGCCGDLSNLAEWRLAADTTSADWQMLWIGHPWSHVRATGSLLHLAEPSDKTGSDRLTNALSIERDELRAAIATAAHELAGFASLLTPLVAELQPLIPAVEVVQILLHGHPPIGGAGHG